MAQSNRSRVFYRHLKTDYATVGSGAGAYITDKSGKQYLDASGGAAVSCLGHGHPRVIAAIKAQLDEMAFAHTGFFTNEPAEQLAEILSAKAPGGAWRVYFLSGGSEANEAALKMARQIHVERGETGRDTFLARRMSYHGNTLGALSVSGNLARRATFQPVLLPNVRHAEPCFAFRHKRPEESETDYGVRAAGTLAHHIEELGEGRAVSFISETVVGATLGAVPPVPGYFKEIRRICDESGALMILDEVMSGMGRTGTLFACEQDGVVPDMITLAKGLGAGYQPIGAVMVREELAEVIETGTGFFQHGHTYVGHPTACAAGLEVQRVFEDEQLVARSAAMGVKLRTVLAEKFADHPHVGDIRGRGLFMGVELVEDRETNAPFDPAKGVGGKVRPCALENGLVCYPGSGTIDGIKGDHVMLAPPFIVSDAQIEELADKLARSIDQAIAT